MKNKRVMKTGFFSVMCVMYLLGAAKLSAKPLVQPALQSIQYQWLIALDAKGTNEQRFLELQVAAKDMFKLSRAHPNDAELTAWAGVMLSSLAGAKKVGSGERIALSAQRMLEKAQVLQLDILDQSHLTNGISAREALKYALVYNPSGLDVNVYYSAFLNEQTINMLAVNTKESLEKETMSSQLVIQAVN